MQVDRALSQLEHYRQQLADLLADARRPLAVVDASQAKALALLRWELMRLLRAYQLFKHTEIFDPLIRAGRSPRAERAAELKGRCLALAALYQAHVQRWSLQGSSGAWEDYRQEALAMAERLERHLATEQAEMRQLLDGVGRVRQGWGASPPRLNLYGLCVADRAAAFPAHGSTTRSRWRGGRTGRRGWWSRSATATCASPR